MTNIQTPTKQWFVNGPSKPGRTVDTLPPELVEKARKLGIAARIKDARERSRWRQQDVADHLEIGIRAYQKLEEKGTSSFERCQEVAEFLGVAGVTADYLWDGTETPDLMGALSAPPSSADVAARLDALDETLRKVAANQTELLSAVAALRKAQEDQGSLPRPDSHTEANSE